MITVYDALGNMIHTAKIIQSNQQIDLSFAAKGIYFLRMSNDHFQSQRKLIIE
jgi:allantoicase